MSVIISKIPLISLNDHLYSSCVGDDSMIYVTTNKTKEIDIFDNNYCYDSKLILDKYYSSITYDNNNKFYLLTTDNKINKIDKSFKNNEEILSDILDLKEKIISISYFNNMLYIVYINEIISVDLENNNISVITENITDKEIKFSSILNYKNNIYISYNIENKAYVSKLNNEYYIEEQYYIDENCVINNILINNKILNLFVTGSVNYIYETNILENEYLKFNTGDRSFKLNLNKKFNMNNNCNFCPNCNNNYCDNNLNSNNLNSNCCNCCDNNCCDCCDNNCNHKKNLCDIIESIALEEAGISHILNAEGEKIQKILASTDKVDLILKVNDSVTKTIGNITILEQVLLAKLQVVADIICNKKCDHKCDHKCDYICDGKCDEKCYNTQEINCCMDESKEYNMNNNIDEEE